MEENRKPFHESVVEILHNASGFGLVSVGELLCKTVIPENHDEIIRVWKMRCNETRFSPITIQQEVVDSIARNRKRSY